ncbi:MAG: alpha-N-acetylglucosaminidase, partial [bacterium]|nr:alpha-N-acetylglucosaminidase [bacterium]
MRSRTSPLRIAALSVLSVLFVVSHAHADQSDAARGLLNRLIPDRAQDFQVESIPSQDGLDVFEIEASDGTVTLRGSTGVAIASALNWYLREYAHCNVSFRGNQLDLPDPLPDVEGTVRIVTPFKHRYCFNFCCFSYSMAWWDWAQWERVIDWMALHGINMPLAVTGQEATWQAVYRDLGLTDEEIGQFFVGPAFLPFGWMGCMDDWCGPLPQSWIDDHRELQQKILAREREFGMTPVLQGFTGHVPEALTRVFPDSTFEKLPSWCGFPGTTFINPADPLFQRIGSAFIEKQQAQYGTDHFYASDTFIEMSPPSNDPKFLSTMADAVYKA